MGNNIRIGDKGRRLIGFGVQSQRITFGLMMAWYVGIESIDISHIIWQLCHVRSGNRVGIGDSLYKVQFLVGIRIVLCY